MQAIGFPETSGRKLLKRLITTILITCLLCTSVWAQPPSVPMNYLPGSEDGLIRGHLFWVPVEVNGKPSKFILDTGIGLNLISSKLARELGCPHTGELFRGQRMSGQTVEVPLSWYSSLSVGGLEHRFITCGVLDFDGFLPRTGEFEEVEGFLSLRFFQHVPFTLDYQRNLLYLETEDSVRARLEQGVVVPIETEDDQGVGISIRAPLALPGIGLARVEVDTGSDSLILHSRYMAPLGLSPESPQVRTVNGKDETEHAFVRYFASGVEAPAQFGDAPELRRAIGRCMFQDIIYDGLVGDDFLKRYTVTFDLPHSRMIFNQAGSQ